MKARLRRVLLRVIDIATYSLALDLTDLYRSRLGILQYKDDYQSGERFLIQKILPSIHRFTGGDIVIDIGANEGIYTSRVLDSLSNIQVHCFEPNPPTAERLATRFRNSPRVTVNQVGVGASSKELVLHDYGEGDGTGHASFLKDVLTEQHRASSTKQTRVRVIDLDSYAERLLNNSVFLIKIDVEGFELEVIKGARVLIQSSAPPVIHFEFNEMNIFSRVFLKDFYAALPGYIFYRLRHDGLIELGDHRSDLEIFLYQNILAVRCDAAEKVADSFRVRVW